MKTKEVREKRAKTNSMCSENEVSKVQNDFIIPSFLNGSLYFVVATVWTSLLYIILYATNVIEVLKNFDSSFRYVQGVTPLTSPSTVATIISCYVISLPVIQGIMNDRKPASIGRLVVIHNTLLMLASAALAAGIAYYVFQDIYKNGFYHSICSAETHDNAALHVLYYMNYLLKFYEFVDTYVILLKKRPLIFLHWYHHAITALLTYIQQNDYTPVQWVPILMNLIVHVVMYSYYLLSSLHIRCWWKQYLTLFQIVQFIVDLVVCTYCALHLWEEPRTCFGTARAAYSGLGVIGSYFLLFIRFYYTNYKAKEKRE